MQTRFLVSLLIILVIFTLSTFSEELPIISSSTAQNGEIITLPLSGVFSDDLFEEIKIIPALSSVTIRATNIPIKSKYVIFQVHSFQYNISLLYDEIISKNNHVNGTNVGLVRVLTGSGITQVFLKNYNLNTNVTVLIAVQAYNANDPIPGGCNMEFAVEVAPYLEVQYTTSLVKMKSQLASPPAPLTCSSTGLLEYEVYHLFLLERDFESPAYFKGLRSMLTVDRIKANGRKVPQPLGLPDIQRVFSAYPGTGSVFAVIVNFKSFTSNTVTAAAYVPSLTYACSTSYWTDTCEVLTSTFSKLLCAIVFFLGIFLCFVGHIFFKTEMFVFGFLSGGLVSYVLVAMPGNFDYGAHLIISVVIGIIFGGFWLCLWWFYAIPALSTVLVSLTLGYLVASITFFAGAGDFEIFQSDMNYWSAFLSVIVVVPLLVVLAAHIANMIACSILGSYAIIAPIDHYIGSNLKYILINTIRRATNKEFRTAVIDPPFQVRDLSLTVGWLVLAILGVCTQLYLQRNKPPFPPPPFGVLQDRQDLLDHERRPLLASQPRNTYATMSGDDDVFEPTAGPSSAH
ncbi:hypothetical protein B566_EDAN006584 [Ephemera danica]|nr:hypothetical protein B566_EDAN006584 [Ephemera danica]